MLEFSRFEFLVGDIEKIQNKVIMIIGVGGVGGYALEGLVRCGVKKIIIVDFDKIDITNINRQLIALSSNIGKYKVDEFEKRAKNINPNIEIVKIKEFIDKNNIDKLFDYDIDYIIDACDTVSTKFLIIEQCLKRNIKFISQMGTGKRLDPTKFQIMDLRKTSYDPIAKKLRKMVKDASIKGKIPVVCSIEQPKKINKEVVPSCSFVPSVAGFICVSYVVRDILGETYGKVN